MYYYINNCAAVYFATCSDQSYHILCLFGGAVSRKSRQSLRGGGVDTTYMLVGPLSQDYSTLIYFYGAQLYCTPIQINSFQCVLVSDGSLSFAIFIYGAIHWIAGDVKSGGSGSGELQESNDFDIVTAATPALVGVNAGHNIQHFTVPESLTEDIININITSNIDVPGIWIFQVNGDVSIPIAPIYSITIHDYLL